MFEMQKKGRLHMKTRKIRLLMILCLLMLLSACDGDEETMGDIMQTPHSSAQPTELPADTEPTLSPITCRIRFAENEAVRVECSQQLQQPVPAGTVICFGLKVSVFYEGDALVRAGEQELTADEQGKYCFTAEKDTVITVEGLTRKESSMGGSGTAEDPFQIAEAVDLLAIAQKVNAGEQDYCNGQYLLTRDLDLGGEQLPIIGDGSGENAVFSGCFMGNGKTISNFSIYAEGSCAGLFGLVCGGRIEDLHLLDFTVQTTEKSTFVGGMLGLGQGAVLRLCSAEKGTIQVAAAADGSTCVGGLIGVQQALEEDGYAAVSYCHSQVDILCESGSVHAAGGIAGCVKASEDGVTAYVNHCYATGNVQGGSKSGGLVGLLASDTAITGCYATGTVSARSEQGYACAGGLVGYGETDAVIAECFSASELSAESTMGEAYEVTNGTLAMSAPATESDYGQKPTVVYNCGHGNDTDPDFFPKILHWSREEWDFPQEGYPTLRLERIRQEQTRAVALTIKAGDREIGLWKMERYRPLRFWYDRSDETGKLIGLPSRVTLGQGSTWLSYGYYFDEACTMAVPRAFVPCHSMTLYAAMADVSAVSGDYELLVEDSRQTLGLTLNKDGTFCYTDAGTPVQSTYIYDGKTIRFVNARFGRYISGTPTLEHYQTDTFRAVVRQDGCLEILGGRETDFFTEQPLLAIPCDNALSGSYGSEGGIYTFCADGTGTCRTTDGTVALTYTRMGTMLIVKIGSGTQFGTIDGGQITLEGVILHPLDMFCGGWNAQNRRYFFDGAGRWSCWEYSLVEGVWTPSLQGSGRYTVAGEVLTMDDQRTAQWQQDGLLITDGGDRKLFYREGSFCGVWSSADQQIRLHLKGIPPKGQGTAQVSYRPENGTVKEENLAYGLDDRVDGRICLYRGGAIFGYLHYDPRADRLVMTLASGQLLLERVDE